MFLNAGFAASGMGSGGLPNNLGISLWENLALRLVKGDWPA